MEQLDYLVPVVIEPSLLVSANNEEKQSPAFITANTIDCSFEEMKNQHIIPVFVKDNEPLISHSEFVDAATNLTADLFHGETILKPQIRVSHPIKGRIPDAKDKPASQLQEWEKTIYYERMMFVIQIPSISDTIDGNQLSLTIGGVKAYNLDNLYSRSLCDQHFKFFVGFQNKVCTNLCVWTDGYMGDLKVKNFNQLKASMRSLIECYNQNFHLHQMRQLADYSITEQQFAHFIGRSRMYNHLPGEMKVDIPPILFGDNQMSTVVKDFYRGNSFCRDADGNINLWKLYNLLTGANKSTYIDSFLDRSVNAFNVVEQIRHSIQKRSSSWYLN
jgi:hypothetical protein